MEDTLKSNPVFYDFNSEELDYIFNHSKIKIYRPQEVILQEGENNTQLFFVLSGKLEIIKEEPIKKIFFNIGEVGENQVIGDMSFVKGSPCSATVKAKVLSKLFVIDKQSLDLSQAICQAIYRKIIANISQINISRLEISNVNYTRSAINYIESLRTQNEFGKFFLVTIITFGIGNIINKIVNDNVINVVSIEFVWIYLLILLLPILFFVVYFKYPFSTFGITIYQWKQSLWDGVIFSIVASVILIGGYGLIMKLLGQPLKHPLLKVIEPRLLNFSILFYFLHSYLQEFIARGVIQTSLQKFLNDDRGIRAVVYTSFLFSIFHLHISIVFSGIVFFGSLVFGLIYLRTKNLLGVSLVHFITGLCAIHLGLM